MSASTCSGETSRATARISIRLETPGFSGERPISRPESVTALLNFLRIAAGSSSTYTVPCSEPLVVDILRGGVLQVHDSRADLGDAVLGHHQHLLAAGEARVEAARHVAHQLQVLALVLADGHLAGAVGEHVGGLQHRVEEQPGRDQLALGHGLVAELVHALQAAKLGDRAQQPAQLGVLVHVPLTKQDAARGSRPAASSSAVRSYRLRRSSSGS